MVRLLAVAVTGKGDGRNEGVGQSQALVKEGELLAEEGGAWGRLRKWVGQIAPSP